VNDSQIRVDDFWGFEENDTFSLFEKKGDFKWQSKIPSEK
jgi:hypothetical protein